MSLTKLYAEGCAALACLVCNMSMLEDLCMDGCSALHTLFLSGCQVRSLDLGGCPHLVHLTCSHSPRLSALDLSMCRELRELGVSCTGIQSLELSASSHTLERLVCDECASLEVISVTGCSRLVSVSCERCPRLQEVSCVGCDSQAKLYGHGSGKFATITIRSLQAGNTIV